MKPDQISELQHSILQVLWDREEATVAQVQDDLRLAGRDLALTTVATLLSRLARRGLVEHRSRGRLYIYRAAVSQRDIRRSMVQDLADRIFGGEVSAVVGHLLGSDDLDPDELARVKELVLQRERELEDKP
ncbi:MAG: BlaI/MecI/CopY family transcriptional regulator [Candidatus Eisenbacteria bacterium]